MVAVTADQQQALLRLQQVDTAIGQLQHRRASLPEQRALDENSELLARVATDHRTNSETLERLTADQQRHEKEVAQLESRRKTEEGRMFSGQISSERELAALRAELASVRGRKNDLEDAQLEIMEQVEELEGMVAALKERHGELRGQVSELELARDEAAQEIDIELEKRGGEREEAAAAVRDDVRALYDELRQRKDGVAVAELRGRTCQGCRLELTAVELEDTLEEAKTGLPRCEQCSRIPGPDRLSRSWPASALSSWTGSAAPVC